MASTGLTATTRVSTWCRTWTRSGLMDLVRGPGSNPTHSLPGMGDHPTAVSLFAGLVMALLHRERTGEGSLVSTSLLANGLWSSAAVTQGALTGADMDAHRQRQQEPGFLGKLYETRDGRWIGITMVRAGNEIKQLFAALDATDLLDDERFSTTPAQYEHRSALSAEVAARFSRRTAAEWMATFAQHGVPAALAPRSEDAVRDPQLEANSMVIDGDPSTGVGKLINHPVQVSALKRADVRRAPDPGEHTEQILREAGFGSDEIDELLSNGAAGLRGQPPRNVHCMPPLTPDASANDAGTADAPYYRPVADEIEIFSAAFAARLPVLLKGRRAAARPDSSSTWRGGSPRIQRSRRSGSPPSPATKT
ncbi:MAG: CoA transferase [Acidimicrobiales bacterium]